MTTRRARISNMSRIRQQKIAPALPVAETQRLFQQPVRASCFWVYAYPAFLMYAAHSTGGYWVRILPQASEIAS